MMVESDEFVSPFLKWAGGKRWLAPKLGPHLLKELNRTNGRYFEPFLGAGAMFFWISPKKSILSDINTDLIITYNEIKKNWLAIANELMMWPVNKEFYYRLRQTTPQDNFIRACRFLYLNRTCYGGLYRENKAGFFNVPYGGGERTPRALWENKLLQNAAKSLAKKTTISDADFECMINKARQGDVVYCDPTYSTASRKQFDRYGKSVFNWSDQLRLAQAAKNAMDRGALVVISNSGCFEISEFYPQAYRICLQKKKTIGNKANCASKHIESLYILDPQSRRKQWKNIGEIVNRKSTTNASHSILGDKKKKADIRV